MALRHDQELRRVLLYRALEVCSDPRAALTMAIRMERFILDGEGAHEEAEAAGEGGATEVPAPTDQGHGRSSAPTAVERRRWTREDDRALRRLWDEKISVDEVAQRLGRTPASIYGRLRWFGLNPARTRARAAAAGDPVGPAPAEAAGGEADPATPVDGAAAPVTAETVVRFLRSRDYSVVRTGDGRYRLDGREVLTAQELLRKANRVREALGRPCWPADPPAAETRAVVPKTRSN